MTDYSPQLIEQIYRESTSAERAANTIVSHLQPVTLQEASCLYELVYAYAHRRASNALHIFLAGITFVALWLTLLDAGTFTSTASVLWSVGIVAAFFIGALWHYIFRFRKKAYLVQAYYTISFGLHE